MIIRSQDKRRIVNFDNIRTIGIKEQIPEDIIILEKYETKVVAYGTTSWVDLGVYESKEKAIKVLDRICDFLFRCDGIFEMPQDSEIN